MTMIVESSYNISSHEIEQSNVDRMTYVQGSIARSIADFLLKEGYIKFETFQQKGRFMPETRVVGSLGVSAHDEVSALKQQLNEARIEGAQEALNALLHKVDQWGSHYGQREVAKWEVRDFAGEVSRSMENG